MRVLRVKKMFKLVEVKWKIGFMALPDEIQLGV